MSCPLTRIVQLCVLGSTFLLATASWAVEQVTNQPPSEIDEFAARIDALVAERWSEAGIEPAPACTDGEFLRRVSLDLTGVVPRASLAREFLEDPAPDKRQLLVAELLASPAHTTHLANTWRHFILPGGVDPEQVRGVVGLQQWLRGQFVNKVRYDRVVADLLVARGGQAADPALFFTTVGLEPEKLAAATARIFLGIQLDCAQCHDHPFDEWTQRDFWGYAAFFSRVAPANNVSANAAIRLVDREQGEVMISDTDTVVLQIFPGGHEAASDDWSTRRQQLALWIASRNNLYLARATVNRVWAQLFGRGIVEPADDLGRHNEPSHPQLLAELSDHFIATGFDLRRFYSTLVSTSAYQLSSIHSEGQEVSQELFARVAVKPLTPEQFYDSVSRAMRRKRLAGPNGSFVPALLDTRRQNFLSMLDALARGSTEYQVGVPQALTFMNGPDMTEATDATQSGLLASLDAPFFSDPERLDAMYLATLTRYPREDERAIVKEYLERIEAADARRAALGDVLWAILNSAEFSLNH